MTAYGCFVESLRLSLPFLIEIARDVRKDKVQQIQVTYILLIFSQLSPEVVELTIICIGVVLLPVVEAESPEDGHAVVDRV